MVVFLKLNQFNRLEVKLWCDGRVPKISMMDPGFSVKEVDFISISNFFHNFKSVLFPDSNLHLCKCLSQVVPFILFIYLFILDNHRSSLFSCSSSFFLASSD